MRAKVPRQYSNMVWVARASIPSESSTSDFRPGIPASSFMLCRRPPSTASVWLRTTSSNCCSIWRYRSSTWRSQLSRDGSDGGTSCATTCEIRRFMSVFSNPRSSRTAELSRQHSSAASSASRLRVKDWHTRTWPSKLITITGTGSRSPSPR